MVEILLPLPTSDNKKTSETPHSPNVSELSSVAIRDANHLIHDHWHMATHIANNYRNISGIEFEDILQHARLALIKAARNYNSTYKILFSTFAWCSIRNELNSLYMRQRKYAYREQHISLRLPHEDEEKSLFEIFPSPEQNAYENISQKELFGALEKSVQKLPKSLRKVVYEVMANRGYREIGKELGYSDMSAKTLVSRAYKRALTLLREEMTRLGYDPSCLNQQGL